MLHFLKRCHGTDMCTELKLEEYRELDRRQQAEFRAKGRPDDSDPESPREFIGEYIPTPELAPPQ